MQNHYDFLFFIMPLRPYSENYAKSAFSHNSSIWCSSDTVLAAHCITRLACLYFGEYPQAVTCSAQPLWCSSHSSCSRPHGLKTFAAPANWNFVGVVCFIYAGYLLFRTVFPDTEIANKYGSCPGPEKLVTRMWILSSG